MSEDTDWVSQYENDPGNDSGGRSRPPIWVVIVVVVSVVAGGWILATQRPTDGALDTSPPRLPLTPDEASVVTTSTASPPVFDPESVVDSTVAESAPIPVYESDTPPMTSPNYESGLERPGCETPSAGTQVREDHDAACSVFGHLLDASYWQGPLCGPGQCIEEGRMDMSDERLSGAVTFVHNGEIFVETATAATNTQAYLYWGTMLIENGGGTWEGTHFAAAHNAQPDVSGPIVMQLVGSGDYEGLSAILYRTVISDPGDAEEESVDGMIFPGDLPPDRQFFG